MIPLYFCLSEFYGHGTSDIMSAELCCLHGLESVVAGLTTKFRTKNKKTFLKFVYHQLMFHVENVQFGESAWSLIISKWFLFSRSSICLSIASSIGIRLDGAVFTTNCISRMVSSKNTKSSVNSKMLFYQTYFYSVSQSDNISIARRRTHFLSESKWFIYVFFECQIFWYLKF